jgi:hypothetical protein
MSIVKLNNRGVRSATTFGSISALGEMRFIKKQTASSSSTISFVDGTSDVVLDNTYKEYLFTFKDIHPATDDVHLSFNASIDSGSNYNVTKTTTNFRANHDEGGSASDLSYRTGGDIAQGTGFQNIAAEVGNDNDQCAVGTLHLFNPSSTTFVKHFISRCNIYNASNYNRDDYVAGYFNTTSAVDAVQFKMSSGNIDAGDICLYGIN